VRQTESQPHFEDEHLYRRAGIVFIVFVATLIAYAIWTYQVQPYLSRNVPQHEPLPLDSPPLELTSFQIRASGDLITPANLAAWNDTLFVTFAGRSDLYLYSGDLNLLKRVKLSKPDTVRPTSIAVTDSVLVVADSLQGLVAVYDHDGYYLTSAAWYPDSVRPLTPRHINIYDGLLTLTDRELRQVSVISLVDRRPHYSFLELLHTLPQPATKYIATPSCSVILPDSQVWILDVGRGNGHVFSISGRPTGHLQESKFTRISRPVDLAIIQTSFDPAMLAATSNAFDLTSDLRVHLLDADAGKVLVYDEQGSLKLVYPRDRVLQEPTAISTNPHRRHIYIAESARQTITVFGY
jgi:hypothetical protein